MKLRVFVITALLVCGFLVVTTKTDWGQRRILNPVWRVRPAVVRAIGDPCHQPELGRKQQHRHLQERAYRDGQYHKHHLSAHDLL